MSGYFVPGQLLRATELNDEIANGGIVRSVQGRVGHIILTVDMISDAAPIDSPIFIGNPRGPTPPPDNNSSSLANTAWYHGQAGAAAPKMDGTQAAGISPRFSRQDHVHPRDTGVLPIIGGTLTGPLTLPVGTAAAPALMMGDTNSGLYGGADNVAISIGGVARFTLNATALTTTLPHRGQDGTALLPAFSFSADPNTGIYRVGDDQLGIATAGVQRVLFDATGPAVFSSVPMTSGGDPTSDNALARKLYVDSLVSTGYSKAEADTKFVDVAGDTMTGALQVPIGTLASPSLRMGDTNSGLMGGADVVGAVTAGVLRLNIAAAAITAYSPVLGVSGTAAIPAFGFLADPDTGIFPVALDVLGFTTAGVQRLSIASTVITSAVPIILPADPTANMHAATKQYVDSLVGGAYTEAEADARFTLKGGDTMTGALQLIAGTAAVPALRLGDTNSGLWGGADVVQIATGGANRLTVSSTAVTSTMPFIGPVGSEGAPSFTFTGDLNSGMYSYGADQLALATGGIARIIINVAEVFFPTLPTTMLGLPYTNANQLTSKEYVDALVGGTYTEAEADARFSLKAGDTMTGALQVPVGTAAAPTLRMGDTNSGFWGGADALGFSTGGTNRLAISGSFITASLPLTLILGTALAPGLVFLSDPNTGFFQPAPDQVAISTNGVQRLGIADALITAGVPIALPADPSTALQAATKQYVDVVNTSAGNRVLKAGDTMTGALAMPNGTAALPALTFSGDTNTGLYSLSADILGFTTGGVARLSLSTDTLSTTVPIALPADPSLPLHAATKQYIDAYKTAATAQFVDLAGDSMTGALQIKPAQADALFQPFPSLILKSFDNTAMLQFKVSGGAGGDWLQSEVGVVHPGYEYSPVMYFLYDAPSGAGRAEFQVLPISYDTNANAVQVAGHLTNKAYVDSVVGGAYTKSEADARYVDVAGDTMTGGLQVPFGTAAIPTIRMGDNNTGLWGAADVISFSAGGTNRLSISTQYISNLLPMSFPLGTALLPSIIPTSDPDSGMWSPGANILAFSTGGVERLRIADTTLTSTVPILLPANPTNLLEAATKQYVDAAVGAAGGYVEAPNDGFTYGRKSLAWAKSVAITGDTITGALNVDLAAAGSSFWAFDAGVSITAPTLRFGPAGAVYGINWTGSLMEFIANGAIRGSIGTSAFSLAVPLAISHNNSAGNTIAQQGSGIGLKITNTGTGASFLVEDAASTDATPFIIDAAGNVGIGTAAPAFLLDVAGAVNIAGATTMAGNLSINKVSPVFALNKAASLQSNGIYGQQAGANRWVMFLGDVAADAADAGSDFSISRYNDAGAQLGPVLSILRSTGQVNIPSLTSAALNISGAAAVDVSTTIEAFRITQRGTGNAFLVEDAASTDPTPFVIDASGNVGIGKAVPAYLLDVAGAGNFTGNVSITKAGATLVLDSVGVSTGAVNWKKDGANLWNLFTSGVPLNMWWYRYDDAATPVASTVLQINRLTGEWGINGVASAGTQLILYTPGAAISELGMLIHNPNVGDDADVDLRFSTGSGASNRRARIRGYREGATNNGGLAFATFVGATATDALILASNNAATFPGAVTINGGLTIKRGIAPWITLDTTDATARQRQILSKTNGLNRWNLIFGDSTAETTVPGAGEGSDIVLYRYTNDGALPTIGNTYALSIVRSTGQVAFNGAVDSTHGARLHVAFQSNEAVTEGIGLKLTNNVNVAGSTVGIMFANATGVSAPRAIIKARRSGLNGDLIFQTAVNGVMSDVMTILSNKVMTVHGGQIELGSTVNAGSIGGIVGPTGSNDAFYVQRVTNGEGGVLALYGASYTSPSDYGATIMAGPIATRKYFFFKKDGSFTSAGPIYAPNANLGDQAGAGVAVANFTTVNASTWQQVPCWGDPNTGVTQPCSMSFVHVMNSMVTIRLTAGAAFYDHSNSGYIARHDGYSVAWNPPSDERMKDNIQPSTVDALAMLRSLPVEAFDLAPAVARALAPPIDNGKPAALMEAPTHVPIGVVAQHLGAKLPALETILPSGAGRDPALPDDLHGVDWMAAQPYFLRAFQQVADLIDDMRGEITTLHSRIKELEEAT